MQHKRISDEFKKLVKTAQEIDIDLCVYFNGLNGYHDKVDKDLIESLAKNGNAIVAGGVGKRKFVILNIVDDPDKIADSVVRAEELVQALDRERIEDRIHLESHPNLFKRLEAIYSGYGRKCS
jgi:hypothetical protein